MAKEKARRKQAIIGRQEEELAARDSSLDAMQKEQASSSRQLEHLQEDNNALKVTAPQAFLPLVPLCCAWFSFFALTMHHRKCPCSAISLLVLADRRIALTAKDLSKGCTVLLQAVTHLLLSAHLVGKHTVT